MITIKNKFTKQKYNAVNEGNYYILIDGNNKYIIGIDEIGYGNNKKYSYADPDAILFDGLVTLITIPLILISKVYHALLH